MEKFDNTPNEIINYCYLISDCEEIILIKLSAIKLIRTNNQYLHWSEVKLQSRSTSK